MSVWISSKTTFTGRRAMDIVISSGTRCSQSSSASAKFRQPSGRVLAVYRHRRRNAQPPTADVGRLDAHVAELETLVYAVQQLSLRYEKGHRYRPTRLASD